MTIAMRFTDEELDQVLTGERKYIIRQKMPAKKVTKIVPYLYPEVTSTVIRVSEIKGTRAEMWHLSRIGLLEFCGLTKGLKTAKMYKVEAIETDERVYDLTFTMTGGFIYVL